jgi:enoyl-CoA hydratase/carnithine racemase
MSLDTLQVEQCGHIKRVTLNRPEKRNAISYEMASELLEVTKQSELDGTRLMILRGEGQGFCAGFDFSNFDEASAGDLLLHFVRIEQMLQAIAHAPFDTLAFAHGQTIGAGADLLIACRHRVGSEDMRMMFPGARFGLILGSRRLAECVGPDRTQQLIGNPRRIDAHQAKDYGILTAVLESTDWQAYEEQVLEHILEIPPDARTMALAACKRDTRAVDLHDLVQSGSVPDIKHRISEYLAKVKAAAKK